LDRSEFRNAARDALQRHIAEKAPQQAQDTDRGGRGGPGDPPNYAGRLHRTGGMESENEAARNYDREVLNKAWHEHQQTLTSRSPSVGQSAAPATPERSSNTRVPGEELQQQFGTAAREVNNRDPVAARAALNQHLEKSSIRSDMRAASREALQRQLEAPVRPEMQPGQNLKRPLDLER
jgi:hypothetical protein